MIIMAGVVNRRLRSEGRRKNLRIQPGFETQDLLNFSQTGQRSVGYMVHILGTSLNLAASLLNL